MARNNNGNRGGNNRGGNSRGRNNNPEGKNQYSWGVVDMARDNPLAATAVAAGAAAAGLFMWSRRSQISNQLSGLSDQFSEWRDSQSWGSDSNDSFDDTAGLTTATATGTANTGSASKNRRSNSRKSQADISAEALTLKETGKAQQPEAIG